MTTKLRWEKPLHATGKAAVADLNLMVDDDLTHTQGFRYHVRRVAPSSRKFVALRDGRLFARIDYPSYDAAIEACETDADSPKSALKLSKKWDSVGAA